MRNAIRPFLFIGLALIMIANTLRGSSSNADAPPGLGSTMYNQYGAVIQDPNGRRISYSREEYESQGAAYRANHPEVPPGQEIAALTGPEATWSYGAFESGIGLSGIITAQNGANREIYSAGSFNAYWIALRYNATTNDYDEIYVSPYFSSPISRIRVADVIGDSAREIIVAHQDGSISFYDLASKALLSTITTAATGVSAMEVADVDGDGANDLVLCTSSHLYVYSGAGTLKWDLAGVGGTDLVVAQMDADPALEIAVTDGHIVDCATHLPQWTW